MACSYHALLHSVQCLTHPLLLGNTPILFGGFRINKSLKWWAAGKFDGTIPRESIHQTILRRSLACVVDIFPPRCICMIRYIYEFFLHISFLVFWSGGHLSCFEPTSRVYNFKMLSSSWDPGTTDAKPAKFNTIKGATTK